MRPDELDAILGAAGVVVDDFTLPFVHRVDLHDLGAPLTVVGLLLVVNVVNFSDGVDGLAAGVCAIAASSFSIIAFDLGKASAAVLAAIVAGAALGFLVHNFHPASVFMGDCGSNLLGYLLGAVIVEGSLKTNALIALVGPLVVLAVPFLDTGFVVAKRLKYERLDAMRVRRMRPEATEEDVDADVRERLVTGEFEQVRRETEEFERVE